MGSTHSQSGSGTSNTGTSEAMALAVYMVEADPNTYKSAMESDEACEWQEAIDSECVSLEKDEVLTFVHEIPEAKKAIPTKLILQRKLNPVGQTVRYCNMCTCSGNGTQERAVQDLLCLVDLYLVYLI